MDCSLIFYAARKTSLCEKTLRKGFAPLGVRVASSCFANSAQTLGERLCEAFGSHQIAVIIGGLDFTDDRSIVGIISRAAAGSHPELVRRLPHPDGGGYLLRAGSQLLLLLPDEPSRVETILRGTLADYMKTTV
ncbi:MAG: hypothetical protein IJ598_03460 [Ruminococcus sp.]|nr:hypothetical protein [Ruminococcus sp.]